MTKSLLQIFGFSVLTLALSGCTSTQDSETDESVAVTTPVQTVSDQKPEPELPFAVYDNFSDLEYIFQHQNDTTYVINFWATWCKPCIAELPYFEQLHTERGAQKLKVVLISLDFPKDVATKLAKFVKQRQLAPEVIAFTDGNYNNWIDKVHPDWGGAIPVTYIYQGDRALFHDRQYDSFEALKNSVHKIITQG